MKKQILLWSMILFSFPVFAQLNFMLPLKSGNIWVYLYSDRMTGYESISRYAIGDSVQLSNSHYYFKVVTPDNELSSFELVRMDSIGNYYFYRDYLDKEFLFYKPSAEIYDAWHWDYDFIGSGGVNVDVFDKFSTIIFGQDVTVQSMDFDARMVTYTNYYCEKFGMLGSRMSEADYFYSLKGCVLDGIVYGDTTRTMVGVKQETQKPKPIILGQNYPNPFNPSTTIPFRLTQAGFVKLSVFDVSGKEIRVLTQGFRSAGDHRVTFSGDDLPSGLYLVRLETQNQTFTKKMMLVK